MSDPYLARWAQASRTQLRGLHRYYTFWKLSGYARTGFQNRAIMGGLYIGIGVYYGVYRLTSIRVQGMRTMGIQRTVGGAPAGRG